MDKKLLTVLVFFALASALLLPSSLAKAKSVIECKDGIDNDGDGLSDLNDPGCATKNDKSELNPAIECDDGIDNDGDGAADYNDGGCSSPVDTDETNCGDGVCEGGETQGTCAQDCGYADSCSDTDEGIVPNVFGTVSGYYNNIPYSDDDQCMTSEVLVEYYCNGDYQALQNQTCGTDGYGADYCMNSSVYKDYTDHYCASGACGSTTTPEFVESCEYGCTGGVCNSVPDSCSDTDGGFVVTMNGTIYGYYDEVSYNHMDFCVDSTTLVEFYCNGAYPANSTYPCNLNQTSTCVSGMCV